MITSVPILMYHAVTDHPAAKTRRHSVTPDALQAQLDFLVGRGVTGITFSELAGAYRFRRALPERPVVVTFDDGYEGVVQHAWPMLRRYGFPATVFVTTGWLRDAGAQAAGRPLDAMMSWAQVRQLAADGVEIGAHSHSHPELDQLDDAALAFELRHSRELLEAVTGDPVRALAYPFGYSSARVRSSASAAGYQYAAAVRNRRANPTDDPFLLPRLTIRRSFDLATFAAALTGAEDRVYRRDRLLTAGWASVRGVRKATKRLRSHA